MEDQVAPTSPTRGESDQIAIPGDPPILREPGISDKTASPHDSSSVGVARIISRSRIHDQL